MSNKLVRVGVLGTLAVLILGLLPATPAFAALDGTASITSTRELFAGRQSVVTFRFNNPPSGTVPGVIGATQPAMDKVQIVPAPGFTISCPATGVPAGWSCLTTSKGIVRYGDADADRTNGGTIPAGQNQSFDVAASAGRPGNDVTRTWQVQMSPDDGDSFVDP